MVFRKLKGRIKIEVEIKWLFIVNSLPPVTAIVSVGTSISVSVGITVVSTVVSVPGGGISFRFGFSFGFSISRAFSQVTVSVSVGVSVVSAPSVVSSPSSVISWPTTVVMSVPGFGIGVSLGFGLRLSHNSGNNESYEEQDFHGWL